MCGCRYLCVLLCVSGVAIRWPVGMYGMCMLVWVYLCLRVFAVLIFKIQNQTKSQKNRRLVVLYYIEAEWNTGPTEVLG